MQHARGFRWSRELRRLINSRRGGVSADLIRATVQGAVARQLFPLLSDVRRVGSAPQGSLMPRAAFQGWGKTVPLSPCGSCFPSLRVGFTLPPPCSPFRFTSFCFRVRSYVVATLFSGEIPRSAIYIFDVASSTPLMLLVRNLPLTRDPCGFSAFSFSTFHLCPPTVSSSLLHQPPVQQLASSHCLRSASLVTRPPARGQSVRF